MSGGHMRNNIIIVAISLFSFLGFIAETKAGNIQKYSDIVNSCSDTKVGYKFPKVSDDACSNPDHVFVSIQQAEIKIHELKTELKGNPIGILNGSNLTPYTKESACSKAADIAKKECHAKSVSRTSDSGVWNNSAATAFNNATKKSNDTTQTGTSCGLDGKDIKTGKTCGGLAVDTTQVKPAPPKMTATSTTQVGGVTYVKIDNGDGTYTTVKKNSDGKTINTIETKKNGHEVVRDENGDRVHGDKKKEVLADKEIFSPEEKQKAADTAQVAAEEKTKEIETNKENPDALVAKNPKATEAVNAAEVAAGQKAAPVPEKMPDIGTEIQTSLNEANQNKDEAKIVACNEASALHQSSMIPQAQAILTSAKACGRNQSVAEFLCPVVNNPAVQTVATMMTTASAAMPETANGTCKATSKINLIGQGLLTAGTAVCVFTQIRCETKCSAVQTQATALKADLNKFQTINCSEKAKITVADILTNIETLNSEAGALITKCKGYKVDTAKMVATALNMGAAAAIAKDCEQKTAAMDSTNNTAQLYTMDEMCSQPQNASSTICKCRTDNTAPGCPGYLAGSGNEGNINKDLNTKGTSNMAGLSYGSKITPTGGASGLDTNLDGLSDEAQKALAAGGDQKQDSPMFGGAGTANAGGGASTASAAGADAGADKGKFAAEPKSFGSSFMNAVGSLFGKGGNSGKAAPAKDDKFASDKYKEQIKRQIAAEQMRSEISSASGMDNWTKIRTRYKSNAGSLIDSN